LHQTWDPVAVEPAPDDGQMPASSRYLGQPLPIKPLAIMTERQPKTRTEANKPAATRHLDAEQKEALDVTADAEHTDGKQREELTRKIEKLGGGRKPTAD
jgi:hypothetical protein